MQQEKIYKAKKSLGQNFLKSEPALRKIIEAGEIKKDDVILEIGPGKGALTSKLLESSNKVIAVEKDYELFGFLKTKFAKEIAEGKLILLRDDILELNLNEEVLSFWNGLAGGGTQRSEDLTKTSKLLRYKIIANIPYNITGAILKKFLTEEHQPESMVLMVQHEVAKRILDKKGSLLSISILAYGEPKMIMKVPKRYFSPAPKVDSAVILIRNISRKNFAPLLVEEGVGGGDSRENHLTLKGAPPSKGGEGNKFENHFWEIVKLGFAHKRKKLSGNLKGVINFQKSGLEGFGNKRAEELTLNDWILLSKQGTINP